eukprot:CAMPEP_0180794448 /NCGR_PEP_ID=MMETSP1038_2-20121128/55619_1 /TAXON_ID=632150 /ORGANISM="Azadinium spinosum, Strain 3D9" /LENGTH=59 /DNA_ID=CAMNT_0022833197 /DNA_START=311 /DNA_END=486 /DNA_ORIENTATION=+
MATETALQPGKLMHTSAPVGGKMPMTVLPSNDLPQALGPVTSSGCPLCNSNVTLRARQT